MNLFEPRVLRFGAFELDAHNCELRKSGVRIRLQPQPLKVLTLLASRAGQVVTREEIQEKVWGNDTFVDFEHGLNFCVKQIRATIGDDADLPRFIETIPKRGYRFIASVESIGPVSPRREAGQTPSEVSPPAVSRAPWVGVSLRAAAMLVAVLAGVFAVAFALNIGGLREWILGTRPSGPIRSLAVLPFKNLSGSPTEEYFPDGMTGELIGELAKIHELRVPSFTSVMTYKGTLKPLPQIARELKVDAIVEGSVLRSGDQVRITVQLLDGPKDQHIWGGSYDGDFRDVLPLQHRVASDIANKIKVSLTPQEQAHLTTAHPVSPEAYDAYLQGRFDWYKRNNDAVLRSIQYYQQAIARDPNYALAYAGLADAYALLGSAPNDAMPPRDAMPRAKTAALRALQLDDTLAEAHASLAYVHFFYEWDGPAAEREFGRALDLNPHYATARHWYAEYLAATGRMDEALEQVKQARDDDPHEIITHTAVAEVYNLARQYDQAIEQCRRTLELEPNFPLAHFHLGRAYLEKAMYTEAIAEFEQAKSFSGGSPAMVMVLGYAHARAGHSAEARKILAELQARANQQYVSSLYFAALYAGLGDRNQAFNWLNRAFQERSDYLVYLKVDPMADSLRSDPRFHKLLHRIGLQSQEPPRPNPIACRRNNTSVEPASSEPGSRLRKPENHRPEASVTGSAKIPLAVLFPALGSMVRARRPLFLRILLEPVT